MKNTLLVIVALLALSCGKGKEAQTYEKVTEDNNTKSVKVDDNATKPAKELTKEDIVGEYELKRDENTKGLVFLDNGIAEGYLNGKKREGEGKWSISKEGEIHLTEPKGNITVLRVNKDGSITAIATIEDGKREDELEDDQLTFKKIK